MSILKNIRKQAQQLLGQDIDIKVLSEKLTNLLPSLQATSVFPSLNQVESQQPELVYVSLTVQDILDTEYYYSYLIKKPISKDSDICVLKYGFDAKQYQNVELEDYQAIMEGRQTLVCISDFYQTNWVEFEWNGPTNIQKSVRVKVSGKQEFKLGQKINAVCVWNPHEKHLIFVRLATSQQVEKHKLSYDSIKTKQIDTEQARKIVIEGLETFCTKPQTLMVLYSMISEEPMFINGQNIVEQISQLLPRVCHVKIKAPFKKSLFPYKNNEGELVQAPMQMSTAKTFVVIDFSEFSNEKEIKIDHAEIDNLKALKMFVEEGRTIYRWEYGESLIEHVHSGIIVKGSKIISPHFHLGDDLIGKKSQKNPFKEIEKEVKQKMRDYIKMCYQKCPKLTQEARKDIETDLKAQAGKEPSKLLLQERLQIARLNAKSLCKDSIDFEDYRLAGKLLGLDQ